MGKKEERKRQQARKHQVKEETGRASVLGMQELKHLFFHLLGTQPPQRFLLSFLLLSSSKQYCQNVTISKVAKL